MHDEGVIKFNVSHEQRPLSESSFGPICCKLIAWREILAKTELVGQQPGLYGGAGYGNVSARVGAPSSPRGARPFLITGTQTSGCGRITLEQFCLVERCDYLKNRAYSRGLIHPSSESLTHGAIYDLSTHIRVVLHAHAPMIWRRARELRLPTTDAAIGYGTVGMAREVQRLYQQTALSERQILAMGGHEDGVIAFGKNAEEAGGILVQTLAAAYEMDCDDAGIGLCRM